MTTMKQTDQFHSISPTRKDFLNLQPQRHRMRAEMQPRRVSFAQPVEKRGRLFLVRDDENLDAIICDASSLCGAIEEIRENSCNALPFFPRDLDEACPIDDAISSGGLGQSRIRLTQRPPAAHRRMIVPDPDYSTVGNFEARNVSFDENDCEMTFSDTDQQDTPLGLRTPPRPVRSSPRRVAKPTISLQMRTTTSFNPFDNNRASSSTRDPEMTAGPQRGDAETSPDSSYSTPMPNEEPQRGPMCPSRPRRRDDVWHETDASAPLMFPDL